MNKLLTLSKILQIPYTITYTIWTLVAKYPNKALLVHDGLRKVHIIIIHMIQSLAII